MSTEKKSPLFIVLLIILLFVVSLYPLPIKAQGSRTDNVVWRAGMGIGGVDVAICQPLATTGASVTANLATFTMSSNPQTAGFVAGMTIQVAGFTGADTYLNAGSLATPSFQITGGYQILVVNSTSVIVALTHANAVASSNGTILQQGNSTTSCAGLSPLYTDFTLSTPSGNPVISDGFGNFGFWAAPGQYYTQYYSPTVTTTLRPVSVPGVGGLSFVASLPALCTPGTTQSVQLSVAPYTINYCSALNTWTALTLAAPGTAFNVTASPYNAIGDGTTDNSTALAAVFTASNAITKGFPTVYFPCQAGKGCQYNYGGSGTSPINPTIPTTIQCDPGVTLNYTGSAHAIDIGVSGLSNPNTSGKFRITGCRFTDSGSETEGIYINQWYVYIEIDHNYWYDSPASAVSTAYGIFGAGENFITQVEENHFLYDTNTAINWYKATPTSDKNTQSIVRGNVGGCISSVVTFAGCTVSGVGVWVGGTGSQVTNNEINFMDPQIRVSRYAGSTVIASNNLENNGGADPVIQYGDPGSAGQIDQLIVESNYSNLHSAAGTLIGPANATDILTNASITNNKVVNMTASYLVALNNQTNQAPNYAAGNACPAIPCLNLHPVQSGVTQNYIQNWITPDHENYSDGFHRANGALTYPWGVVNTLTMPTISSNVLTCASSPCEAQYSYDLPNNQRVGVVFNVVPTGTDNVAVQTRTINSTTGGATNYICAYTTGTGIQMFAQYGGSAPQLGATKVITPNVGDFLEMESIGSIQTCYLNGVPVVAPTYDANVTYGYAAVEFVGTTGKISAFTAKGLP